MPEFSSMNEDERPDPDDLLALLRQQDHALGAGQLIVFLGMCPGVGKTYAMLQAGHRSQLQGQKVLVGVIETHGRSATAALLEGLQCLPLRRTGPPDSPHQEFDLDAVLRLKPDLVLVDELAHTNAPGSRHAKRYQDVLELLDKGINVSTTLNVQHIESHVDVVQQITGITIKERVPDSILDCAHEIQLIDLSVEQLLERLHAGQIYQGDRADTAARNFFRESNLTALRELALRFTAGQVDRDLTDLRRSRRVSSPWKTNARLLVGVGPSPYAESLIRWTRRAATRMGCPWLVVWVEGSRQLPAEDQKRLASALALARQLGAEVLSLSGENVASALLQVARERNVSQIVVGKPDQRRWWRRSLADQVIDGSGDIEVCAVRPLPAATANRSLLAARGAEEAAPVVASYSFSLMITFLMVSLGLGLLPYTGYVFVGLAFLIIVTLTGLWLRRGPVLLMAALSALSWDFFFIDPRFTLYIAKLPDVFMFGMFFIVALSMGHLTTRLRQREQTEVQRSRLISALLRVTQSAALSADPERGLAEAIRTIEELLGAATCLVIRNEDHSLAGAAHPASTFQPPAKEWGVAGWSYQNRKIAGRFTDTLPQSHATWFPLQTSTAIMGVLGIRLPQGAGLDFTRRQAIEAFALQLALVLEKDHFLKANTQVELLTQSERLQRTLLDSVSHELKTPLAVIQACLDGLADLKNPYVHELQTASQRLQRVVHNLLQMTRIESAAVQPIREWCLPGEVLQQAIQSVEEAMKNHPVVLNLPPGLPAVSLDPTLYAQAVANILHNAAVYTPPGTPVHLSAFLTAGGILKLTISDSGPGLPAESLSRIFDKFYRAPGSPAGGTGLGLPIAQALIRALGGRITADNQYPHGAVFQIAVPVKTLPL